MTPSFVPKEERKRKLEKKAAREAMEEKRKFQAAKKLAERIAKEYRKDREEKWPWDQHDSTKREIDAKKLARDIYLGMKRAEYEKAAESEKKPRKKQGGLKIGRSSTIEGISEAIGNKLKERMEKRSNKQKESEKRASQAKDTFPPKENSSKSRKPRERSKLKDNTKYPGKANAPRDAPRPKDASEPPKAGTERLGSRITMKYPEVRGEKITSKERLRELTNDEYSALKRREDFPRRMKEAKTHLDLMKNYEGQERLEYGDISRIAKDLKVDAQTVSNWLTKGMTPRLYTYLKWATPRSEASEKVRGILEANKGVRSPQDVYQRLDNYYLGPEERSARFAKREEKKMLKYYEFLDRYAGGGNHLDIAREVGVSDSGARAYLDGATPRWVGLAGQIPSENPRPGYKWLPKKYEHGGHGGRWSDWIEVPEKVTDHKQIMEVLGNLEPLDNADMRRWEKKFGGFSRGENFMYLLGVTVSDSNVPSLSTGAISMGMNLSKAYDWSQDFGDATCYYLGQLGIRAGRVKDAPAAVTQIETKSGIKEIRSEEQYKWMSENRSLLRWMRRSCLGYDDSPKTYQASETGWLLRAPDRLRHAFLQGVSDGDGGVSKKSYYFSISTHSDHDLVEGLFSSFGIGSYRSRTYVRTDGFASLKRVAEVQPFRHAESRIFHLEKTVQMIEARKRNIKTNPPAPNEIRFIANERASGASFGAINEKIFDTYGYTLDTRTIQRLIEGSRRNVETDEMQ